MASADTTLLAPSPLPGTFPVRQRLLLLGENEPRTARVLPRYRRQRKQHRERQADNEKDRGFAVSDPLQRSDTSTADDGGTDENAPQETKPLLIVDVAANVSDVSEDCPSTPGVVDRTAKLNGLPANVAVSVETAATATRSSKVWTKWRKLQSGLELKRRVTERLAATEWWRRRRRRTYGGEVAESSTVFPHRQKTLDPKSFPDDNNLIGHVVTT